MSGPVQVRPCNVVPLFPEPEVTIDSLVAGFDRNGLLALGFACARAALQSEPDTPPEAFINRVKGAYLAFGRILYEAGVTPGGAA